MTEITMHSNTSRRRRASKGTVIMETALTFIAFAGMLLGAFDFGQFLFIHQAIVERARYAARWGSINDPTNATGIRNMVLYYQSTVPNGSPDTLAHLTAQNVSVTTSGSGTDDYRLNVRISG